MRYVGPLSAFADTVVRVTLAGSIVATSACASAPNAAREPRVHASEEAQAGYAVPFESTPSTRADGPLEREAIASIDPTTTVPVVTFVSESAARCANEMVLVEGRVCIDRYEASLVGFDEGREIAMSPFTPVDGLEGFRAVSRASVVPQGYISGAQAERACRASGKRLCTANEWEGACRGAKRTQFPYGEARRAGACNDDVRARHPVIEAASRAGIASGRLWTDGMNLPEINQLPDSLLPTGERAECATPDGVYDLVGNLHEWVADADGTFRGGYYMDTSQNGEGCSYQTTGHDFTYHDYSTGFRCCSDPDSVE